MQTDFFLPLLCEMHSSITLISDYNVQCKKGPFNRPKAPGKAYRGLCHNVLKYGQRPLLLQLCL